MFVDVYSIITAHPSDFILLSCVDGFLWSAPALAFKDDGSRHYIESRLRSLRSKNSLALKRMMVLCKPYSPFTCGAPNPPVATSVFSGAVDADGDG
jgi:hypothetical protein